MQFEFMGAFRDREGDDKFSRYLRVLRATCFAVVAGAFWLMGQTAWLVEYYGRPAGSAVVGAMLFSIFVFVIAASLSRLVRPYALPAVMLLALAAGEMTTLFRWWEVGDVLGWWRAALLLAAAACTLLWAGEKGVRLRRSRGEGLGSSA